ncbi:nucleotide exchange factor GrpE [Gemmiger formicilis]|uniref:nucleotide exchange factor GrpE n=1 Tax=Gemmiger formicilis TaxID=745368 RepID=UPI00195837C2|nr:nucleotide exchange factor GrpE [Gemmiger formicilis]MBM6913862.1 nucleotide exchange factor GrpE [Gemmiger formicilis]HIX34629.1 nucleotide exchange factor GrpE [Candidatus Gemmiger avium]
MSEETKRTDAPQPEPAEQPAPETDASETQAPENGAGGENRPDEAAVQALQAKLDAAEKKAAELKDQLLRTAAEYDNFRKRSAREQDASFNNGVGFAVNQILGILDTLEMAANAPTTDENYKKGVVMTLDKAAAALNTLKVEEIPAQGQPFDPNVHAAVQQVPAEEGVESGTVVQVYQKGYRLGDRVIRHATVVVAE